MDRQTQIEVLNIVAFVILMENNKGILNKSPEYIMEKFSRYCQSQRAEYYWGLDPINRSKLDNWIIKWLRKGGGEDEEKSK